MLISKLFVLIILYCVFTSSTVWGFGTKTSSSTSSASPVWVTPLLTSGLTINDKYFVIEEAGEYTIYVSCYGDSYRKEVYINDNPVYVWVDKSQTLIETINLVVGDTVSIRSTTDHNTGTYKYCSVSAFIVKN